MILTAPLNLVLMIPGAKQFIRMFLLASSGVKAFVNPEKTDVRILILWKSTRYYHYLKLYNIISTLLLSFARALACNWSPKVGNITSLELITNERTNPRF